MTTLHLEVNDAGGWRRVMSFTDTVVLRSAVIEAARCIRHWHDAPNEGMVVSGSHVRELWKALNNYDAARKGEGE